MRQGRNLRWRYLFPELAAVGIQFERLLLRLRWALLSPIDLDLGPLWSLGSLAGVFGVLLTILLFLFRPAQSREAPVSVRLGPREEWSQPAPRRWYDPRRRPEADLIIDQQFTSMGADRRQTKTSRALIQQVNNLDYRQDDDWRTFARNDVPMRQPLATPYSQKLNGQRGNAAWDEILPTDHVDPQSRLSSQCNVGIEVKAEGGQRADEGDSRLTYTLVVRNVGDHRVELVTVTEGLSIPMDSVTDTNPPAEIVGNALRWELRELEADDVRRLTVTVLPDLPRNQRSFRHGALVEVVEQFAGVIAVAPAAMQQFEEDRAPPQRPSPPPFVRQLPVDDDPPPITRKIAPKEEAPRWTDPPRRDPQPARLTLRTTIPAQVKEGETVRATFAVVNEGEREARDVVIVVELPTELQHRYGRSIEHKIARLAPGQKQSATLLAVAKKNGSVEIRSRLSTPSGEIEKQVSNLRIQQFVKQAAKSALDIATPSKASLPITANGCPCDTSGYY